MAYRGLFGGQAPTYVLPYSEGPKEVTAPLIFAPTSGTGVFASGTATVKIYPVSETEGIAVFNYPSVATTTNLGTTPASLSVTLPATLTAAHSGNCGTTTVAGVMCNVHVSGTTMTVTNPLAALGNGATTLAAFNVSYIVTL